MTKQERMRLAHLQAQKLVAKLRASNERAALEGAPAVAEEQYQDLESTLARKLLRAA